MNPCSLVSLIVAGFNAACFLVLVSFTIWASRQEYQRGKLDRDLVHKAQELIQADHEKDEKQP